MKRVKHTCEALKAVSGWETCGKPARFCVWFSPIHYAEKTYYCQQHLPKREEWTDRLIIKVEEIRT